MCHKHVPTFVVAAFMLTCYVSANKGTNCFAELSGPLDDVNVDIESITRLNNFHILPRLNSLLLSDYFHFCEVNLERGCPFFNDDLRCILKECRVTDCPASDLPIGLREELTCSIHNPCEKYGKPSNLLEDSVDEDIDCQLGKLDSSLSDERKTILANWTMYDAQDETKFCESDDGGSGKLIYVDLLKNPEAYTGYKGPASHRIWHMIYAENCFSHEYPMYGTSFASQRNDHCLEKRTFYRLISGLHTSIAVHLSHRYPSNQLLNALTTPSKTASGSPQWRPNVNEFRERFDPAHVHCGPHRLQNLYFAYLVELRALAKAAPYLRKQFYYTGNPKADDDTRRAVHELLLTIESQGNIFNEQHLFADNSRETIQLKQRFRQHFHNISRIMDCVGCDKCRLWGKLQILGMGTALKILFSAPTVPPASHPVGDSRGTVPPFQLSRREIVALFNAVGRLSNSIGALRDFCKLLSTST
ncbi:unnamed protein product [Calicophoron daubneyi]|uniref:Endoplasmic reticulum oxidoreductin 1 n=1 Tax=Calicophoron daubneyi TaxID=300641 RepID=A0AAV2TK14_CALDB